MLRPCFTPQKHFILETESTQNQQGFEESGKFKKYNGLIGPGTHGLPACSLLPQATTQTRASLLFQISYISLFKRVPHYYFKFLTSVSLFKLGRHVAIVVDL